MRSCGWWFCFACTFLAALSFLLWGKPPLDQPHHHLKPHFSSYAVMYSKSQKHHNMCAHLHARHQGSRFLFAPFALFYPKKEISKTRPLLIHTHAKNHMVRAKSTESHAFSATFSANATLLMPSNHVGGKICVSVPRLSA